MVITGRGAAAHWAKAGSLAQGDETNDFKPLQQVMLGAPLLASFAKSGTGRCRLVSPQFASLARTNYTRNFAARFAADPGGTAAGALLEILDLRHFSSADLRPLLEDEAQLWSRLLSWDYSGSAEMILRYVDAKILPGYAAIERGRIFGYTFFVYEGSKGVVGDLF